MFDPKDIRTLYSLRELQRLVAQKTGPVVWWVGAGASKWCGYPLWDELAINFHDEYRRHEKDYDLIDAGKRLTAKDYPGLFSYCKKTNSQRYYRLLADTFGTRELTPVYRRLTRLLTQLSPVYILTTNVDESLERNVAHTQALQRPILERVIELMNQERSFVAKLHGTISNIESTVFTTEDYAELVKKETYLSIIENVFSRGTVIFIGYSLSDEYVINLLRASSSKRPIFGTGPHFALFSRDDTSLPNNTKRIKYSLIQHKDHRAALQVVNLVVRATQTKVEAAHPQRQESEKANIRSAYYISDFYPPGTWQSSQTVTFEPPTSDGVSSFTVGQGFIDSEVTVRTSTAMHDLTVGLLCFDEVYMPISSVGMLHDFLGAERFWNLHDAGAIRFIQLPRIIAMGYEDASGVANGRLMSVGLLSKESKTPMSTEEEIERQIIPLRGHEKSAEPLLDDLVNKVVRVDEGVMLPIRDLTKGALMHPDIRQLLGISEAVLPESIPRWNLFPVLRLAHVITVGAVCQSFLFGAAKMGFGGEILASRGFALAATHDWAEDAASYILSQKYNSDLGSLVMNEPSILDAILRFRDTQAGAQLRDTIRKQLTTEPGSEFIASVNAGLARNIPAKILQEARDQLSGLLLAQPSSYQVTPAVWNNLQNSDSSLSLWRKRSYKLLVEYCAEHKIGPYDHCPCGSGEKLRFCCEEALRP
jgi:hypothetical protein